MKIQQEEIENNGRFFISQENETMAEMDYKLAGENILLIMHTEVSETLAGKGIGKQLVSTAVDYAREKSFVIKSVCSFAKAILDKTPEFADVYHAKNKN